MQVFLQQIYTGHADALYALERGLTDQAFYSGSADTFVGSWNVLTGTFEKPIIKAGAPVYCLLPVAKEHLIYIGARGGYLYQADLSRRKAPRALEAHRADIFALALHPLQPHLISAGGDGLMNIWSRTDLQLLTSFKLSDANIRTLAVSPSGHLLAAGLSDHSIRIFDTENYRQLAILKGHTNSVFTLIWKNDSTLLSGGRDAMLRKWESKELHQWQETQALPAHMYTINHLLLSPDQKILASASRDKSVKIWDAETLQLLKVMDRPKYEAAHTHSVNRLLWLDHETLLSAGDDKRILSWQVLR